MYLWPLILSGSSDRVLSGGNEEELETSLRKWNPVTKPQGELLKTEVFNKFII